MARTDDEEYATFHIGDSDLPARPDGRSHRPATRCAVRADACGAGFPQSDEHAIRLSMAGISVAACRRV